MKTRPGEADLPVYAKIGQITDVAVESKKYEGMYLSICRVEPNAIDNWKREDGRLLRGRPEYFAAMQTSVGHLFRFYPAPEEGEVYDVRIRFYPPLEEI